MLDQADGAFDSPRRRRASLDPLGWGTSAFDYDNDGDSDLVQNGGMNVGFAIAAPPAVIMQNQG